MAKINAQQFINLVKTDMQRGLYSDNWAATATSRHVSLMLSALLRFIQVTLKQGQLIPINKFGILYLRRSLPRRYSDVKTRQIHISRATFVIAFRTRKSALLRFSLRGSECDSVALFISGYTGIDIEMSRRFVWSWSKVIKQQVTKGNTITIAGLGRFYGLDIPMRIGKNIKTGATIRLLPYKKLKLKISAKLTRFIRGF